MSKQETKDDAHTPSTSKGREKSQEKGKEAGRDAGTGRPASDSTGINAEAEEPKDPKMPHMPPA